ncbi:MAG: universal stress protein [Verrucomicrobia bacterium]|nr:universal stress protein [Verrucomicrobiota bacterium]
MVNRGERKRGGAKAATLKLRRILVPLDFSGKSRQALDFAVPLAKQYGGKVFLLHVVEPPYVYPYHPGEIGVAAVDPRPIAEASKKKLSALARELVPPDVLGKTMVRTGRAYLEIVDAADELGADLIALSTHGHTGLKHVLLGSTAEHVVRHARRPVLTVRRH